MNKIEKETILLLYQLIVQESGGSFGIKSEELLESAIAAPFQTFDGKELYPTKIEKAARLGYGLVSNHPFIDGNKRIGLLVMASFLERNGIHIKFSDEETTNIAMNIADGKMDYDSLLKYIKSKT